MVRHPKGGRGSKWTALELKKIPAEWVGDTLSEEKLHGAVHAKATGEVSVYWKTSYQWQGKLKWARVGVSPRDSLESIRAAKDEVASLVRQGIDPAAKRQEEKKPKEIPEEFKGTVPGLMESWLTQGVNREDGNKQLRAALTKHLIPNIPATKPLNEITTQELSVGPRLLIADGKIRTADMIVSNIRTMFRWGEKTPPFRKLLIEDNPALRLDIKLLAPANLEIGAPRERTLSEEEIKELWGILQGLDRGYETAPNKLLVAPPLNRKAQCAIWICLSTLCRIGELSMAEWSHVDLEKRVWFIPKENTKKTRAGRTDHYIYLSDFSLGYFKSLKEITGGDKWLFPSKSEHRDGHIQINAIAQQIGLRQASFHARVNTHKKTQNDTLVLAGGAKGEWTPHDLRRTGATLMQKLKIDPNVIDRCQHHVLAGSKVRRHYLHHTYDAECKEAWELLGKHLEKLTNGV